MKTTAARSGVLGRVTARAVAWAAGLAAMALLGVFTAFMAYERNERLEAGLERAELVARVLEDHATRSVEAASLALAALAEQVVKDAERADPQVDWVLQQTMAGLPVLRGLAVLDSQGLVVASTEPAAVGRVLDTTRLGPPPPPGQSLLGPFVQARGIGQLVAGATPLPTPRGVGFMPLLRQLQAPGARSLLLVGLVNPDAIANHQDQVVAEPGSAALLASLGGQVLAATGGSLAQPGQSVRELPVFAQVTARIEHASYLGAGANGPDQLVAFRASRTRPLVVVVETSRQHALQAWWREVRLLGALALFVSLAIVLLGLLAARSLRAREAAQAQRDAAQAEVALRERELSVIVKSVQELLFRTDAQGCLTFVNARWLAATGQDEQSSLGRPLASFVHPDSRAAVQALFDPTSAEGVRAASVRLGEGAAARHFDVAVAPLRAEGRAAGFAGSAVDVTERRNAQARLQSQLAFTELLLDVMPLPLSILDAQGRYVSVNQAWQEFTGRTRADVTGRQARDFQPAAMREQHDAQDRELLAHGGRVRYESQAQHGDGTLRDLALTKAAIPGPDGRPSGILVAFMDVTEFREAERATREARDAAEEASRAKTEFIGNISHELRTPLQSIIGFSELGQARSGEARRLGAMFGDIHAAGHRMLALVNDLLDVAKIESTVGTFHLERVDIRSLVRDVVGELAPLLQARQLQLGLQLSEGPLVAKVDPLRFQQVVRNVLANAIRFSPTGAGLAVTGDIGEDHQIHLSVRDQGPGIPPAELEQIFEAFVQSSKTKDGSGGTGLGLAISRKILQAHGGSIRAENNPGGGATFHIVLPARGFSTTLAPE